MLLAPLIVVMLPSLAPEAPEVLAFKREAVQRGLAEYFTYEGNDWIFWRWKGATVRVSEAEHILNRDLEIIQKIFPHIFFSKVLEPRDRDEVLDGFMIVVLKKMDFNLKVAVHAREVLGLRSVDRRMGLYYKMQAGVKKLEETLIYKTTPEGVPLSEKDLEKIRSEQEQGHAELRE
jgi:hypothetical protein